MIVMTVIVVLLVFPIVRVVHFYQRQMQAARAFVFMHDLVEFANTHGYLPSSIEEFCQWKKDENGRVVWNAETTARKVRFLWLSPDFSVSNGNHFLAILDPSITQCETALNEHFIGLIPSNILNRAVEDSKRAPR